MGELRGYGAYVANETERGGGGAGVAADFGGTDVDLDEYGVGVPFRGFAEVEDPVESRAENEDYVCVLECDRTSARCV